MIMDKKGAFILRIKGAAIDTIWKNNFKKIYIYIYKKEKDNINSKDNNKRQAFILRIRGTAVA